VTIEVQCTSCHTRYRIDEHILPAGLPTFKCSRCGHVFNFDPRTATKIDPAAAPAATPPRAPRPKPKLPDLASPAVGENTVPDPRSGWVVDSNTPSRTPAPKIAPPPSPPASVSPVAPVAAPPPAESKPSTDELMSRPFREEVSPPTGENLKFEFNNEPIEPEAPARNEVGEKFEIGEDRLAGDWQVGDAELEAPPEPPPVERPQPRPASIPKVVAPPPRPAAPAYQPAAAPPPVATKAPRFVPPPPNPLEPEEDEEFLDEDAAPIYNRSVATHSARTFVALFAIVALGYGAMTMLIRSSPATAAVMLSHLPKVGDRFVTPMAPARLVAMRDVHADYLRNKGGHTVLVVTGIAENVGNKSLHAVQIAASLRDATQRPLANRTVYCGNNLSAAMVAQMTPHELDFFQKLDPPKAFSLDPSTTSPFVIVFIDPPATVSGFDVSVASAIANMPSSSADASNE
jgi:predicted Zn finger-like uncharacterized protein